MARVVFPDPAAKFSVEVDLTAEMTAINPFDFFLEPHAEVLPFSYDPNLQADLGPFLGPPCEGSRLSEFVASLEFSGAGTVRFLVDVNQRLQREVRYLVRMEPGVQTPEETLELASGSCRDSAWLLVEILRRLGLAARFVSGYLIQLRPDVKPLSGPQGPEEDFTDLHAWAEVYLPGAGWVGLDPTSGLFAGEGHIPLAATPHPFSAAPVTGLVSQCEVDFRHEMRVTRIREDPRVTKPFSDLEWDAILAMGDKVDDELIAGNIRLTMGGEPTFVSMDDLEGEEWTTAAVGPTKRLLANRLLHRLRDSFAEGGLLHFAQGKWYPGESLPRWAFTVYWRTDGLALWRDPALIADPDRNYGWQRHDALRFAEELAVRLSLPRQSVLAAYEDPLAYVHAERQLPLDVDPENNNLDDPEERERLRRVFSRGLGQPSGYVLPLQRLPGKNGPEWQTGLWMMRSRHLFLIPGDSPVGLRLPLQSLRAAPSGVDSSIWMADPMGITMPLPRPGRERADRIQRSEPGESPPSDGAQRQHAQTLDGDPGERVRTALTVEARDGCMFVFLPPVASGDDFAELIDRIEQTAEALAIPVALEGYAPPPDPRLQQIKVTPDPGVIEVNIHPSATWRQLVENTTALYDQARSCRLMAEKFMIDGRHTGTGGGNHIVLGGRTPADSPFLRRPDLLKSFVGYWLNHPSLSYLFSSLFIGPTSQAPRVDETRQDAVYELEIAFALLEGKKNDCPPWLVDRIFRDLLVDVTGNTHRSEFCIDKLFSPDSASGRLGLLEMRAFEMPPHPRMSLAQQLLVRGLLAWFWRQPYEERPVRWGTRLHDRFLLPHYTEQDLLLVLKDLSDAGFEFDPSWFAPHLEFRFPAYGTVCPDGVEIELRQAIEPWYVLGEQPGGGGTTRFVDSSVERLQVRVKGLMPERHAVTCNRYRLPLQPLGPQGEFVCGVRFRAWQPPRCLHPTIPVHAPLVFDLYDIAGRRSRGGCIYHAAHPGGRNYETFPVNSGEAEARRRARFFPFGHTPGTWLAETATNWEFPSTLDLRTAPRGSGGR
jgi:uncharacterized protein (DUF2126 family)